MQNLLASLLALSVVVSTSAHALVAPESVRRTPKNWLPLLDIRAEAKDFARVYVNGHRLTLSPGPRGLDSSVHVLGVGGADDARPLLLLSERLFGEDLLILAVYKRAEKRLKLLGFASQSENVSAGAAPIDASKVAKVENIPMLKLLTTRSAFELARARQTLVAFTCSEDEDASRVLKLDLIELEHLGLYDAVGRARMNELALHFNALAHAGVSTVGGCAMDKFAGPVEDAKFEVYRLRAQKHLRAVADQI